jgi:D-amino-acid dehydrogenase
MWRWGLQMLANCTARRYEINKGRMLPLAAYSRDVLRELRAETGVSYDERSLGTLQMFRTQKQVDGAARDIEILKDYGVPFEILDVAGCVKAEPALGRVREKIVGGLRLPGDETGDCFKFTNALAKLAESIGVEMRYGVNIRRLVASGDALSGIETDTGTFSADRYVLALGSYSPQLLKPLGIDIPVYPVKGYSITLPITHADAAPVSTVMDETYKVAVTRLGDRIRAAGTAELAGYNLKLRESRLETIKHVVGDLFKDGGDLAQAEGWCGLRPMTPDGTPIVGATRYRNLLLNTGHGTLGWTMGCGSGKVIADLISGRKPEVATEGLSLDRYR